MNIEEVLLNAFTKQVESVTSLVVHLEAQKDMLGLLQQEQNRISQKMEEMKSSYEVYVEGAKVYREKREKLILKILLYLSISILILITAGDINIVTVVSWILKIFKM